jgi:hypothetical protein
MRRREFITLLGGAAACSLAARAQQQADRVRRIGWLMGYDENDPVRKTYVSAFTQVLADLGWMAVTCGWTFGGSAMTSIGRARLRRSWSAWNPKSS